MSRKYLGFFCETICCQELVKIAQLVTLALNNIGWFKPV